MASNPVELPGLLTSEHSTSRDSGKQQGTEGDRELPALDSMTEDGLLLTLDGDQQETNRGSCPQTTIIHCPSELRKFTTDYLIKTHCCQGLGKYLYPHWTDEETEVQRREVTCPWSHSEAGVEPKREISSPDSFFDP